MAPPAALMPGAVDLQRTLPGMPQTPAAQPTRGPTSTVEVELAPGPARPEEPLGEPFAPYKKTMLGVAMPGIAPLSPGIPKEDERRFDQRASATQPSANWDPVPANRVAPPVVEIAPAREGTEAASSPLLERTSTRPRRGSLERQQRDQVRFAAFLALGAALGLLGGGAILVAFGRTPPKIQAEGRVDALGNDVLHLSCPNCPDGTLVTLGEPSARFERQAADIVLPSPLAVGDNAFTVLVRTPSRDRGEKIDLVVPVAYRLRTDTTELDSATPTVRIVVEVAPKTRVRVAGRDVTVGGDGRGVVDLDVTTDCTGPGDEAYLDRRVEFEAHVEDRVERGTMAVHVPMPALRVDTPNATSVVETETIRVAGHTARGARLTLGSTPLSASPEGEFSATIPLAQGETDLALRAALSSGAPRIVHLRAKRVDRLIDEAREFANSSISAFSDLVPTAGLPAGQPVVLEGELFEVRPRPHASVALLDVATGCASHPCLARVLLADSALTRGARVKVFGRLVRFVLSPSSGDQEQAAPPVPEIAADFTLPSGR